MSRDDEKTRIKVPAVKRRTADVSNVATRPAVRAVKRAAQAQKPKLEDCLDGVDKVSVARRGGLRNAANDKEDGWLVREQGGADLFHFVPADEPMLAALARGFGSEADIYFDVMRGKASVACAVLHGKATYARGSAELLDGESGELATLHLGKDLEAECVGGAHPHPLLVVGLVRPGAAHATAKGRLVATVEFVTVGEMIPRLDHYAVSFQNRPSNFERLLTVTAISFSDAFEIRSNYRRSRRHH